MPTWKPPLQLENKVRSRMYPGVAGWVTLIGDKVRSRTTTWREVSTISIHNEGDLDLSDRQRDVLVVLKFSTWPFTIYIGESESNGNFDLYSIILFYQK